jgi:hypothetical protein
LKFKISEFSNSLEIWLIFKFLMFLRVLTNILNCEMDSFKTKFYNLNN